MSVNDSVSSVLSIIRCDTLLKVRLYSSDAARMPAPLNRYDELRYDSEQIERYSREIIRLLHNANLRDASEGRFCTRLQNIGFALFESLLPAGAQTALRQDDMTGAHLVLHIDDSLVHIPWELLHTGQDFLCTRFCMGRIILTHDISGPPGIRENVGAPARVLLLCDPRGDLQQARTEGVRLRSILDQHPNRARADLLTCSITHQTVHEHISAYDILHYAGHAEHVQTRPDESGWHLQDRSFSARDIQRLSRHRNMPRLVFSNACQSGLTDAWFPGAATFGLAHAFLLSGVQHYIGALWEVLDEAGSMFAANFYRHLVAGHMIGEALRLARLHVKDSGATGNLAWAGYVMYGTPSRTYCNTVVHNSPRDPERPAAVRAVSADHKHTDCKNAGRAPVTYILIGALLLLGTAGLALRHIPRAASALHGSALSTYEAYQWRSTPSDHEVQSPDSALTAPDPTIFILGFTSDGVDENSRKLERFCTLDFTRILTESRRMQVVERQHIAALYDEQRISGSAGRGVSAGHKIVGARFIAKGEIVRLQNATKVNVRVFETATSNIVLSLQVPLHNGDYQHSLRELAKKLVKHLGTPTFTSCSAAADN